MSSLEKSSIQCLEEWLDSYLNFERTPKKGIFWLDTVHFLCNRFNNPEKSYKSVHIAGSKGKGSVSTMLSSIIKEYKGNCGLYTSPHILSLAERITDSQNLLDEKIYENALKELICRVESIIPEQLPNQREITWFELITLYSFLCFREAKFSWAVFETGLGGRLDATNILMPELSVITPIELEHTDFLGDTIEKIAFEKAGILKENVPVCISKQSKEALEVIKSRSKETNSKVYFYEDYIESLKITMPKIYCGESSNKMSVKISYKDLFSRPIKANLSLIGQMQGENAALAALCAKVLFPEISETVIEKGLEKAQLQGRFEIVKNPINPERYVILDGAHTVNSIDGTLKSFREIFQTENQYEKSNLVFAAAADKDINHIASLLLDSSLFSKVYLTKPGSVKASDLSKIKEVFEDSLQNDGTNYLANENFEKVLEEAITQSGIQEKNLLITGSFYLVAEAKKVLLAISSRESSEIV